MSVTGLFPSLKLGRMVAFESTIERDYLYLLDFDPEVIDFEEQPLTLTYRHHGKGHHYTPDFRLRKHEREILVECKPEARVNNEENQRKFTAARAYCEARRLHFQVVTEAELRRGYRLANVKQLTYYARLSPPPQALAEVLEHLRDAEAPLTIVALSTLLGGSYEAPRALIYHLAYHHQVLVELDTAPLGEHSLVSLARKRIPL